MEDFSWLGAVITAVFSGAVTIVTAYLAFRDKAERTKLDMMREIDERTQALIERMEADLTDQRAQLTDQRAQMDRLERIARDLRRLVNRVLRELRRHDPDTADAIEAELP